MNDTIFVGLDVHKATVAVAVAEGMRGGEVRQMGSFPHRAGDIDKLAAKLAKGGQRLSFCYEAGPCGYGLYRQLPELGHDCIVVAPSLIKANVYRERQALTGEVRGPRQDRPARCRDAGQVAPGGRIDGSVGSRCGA